MLRSGFARTIHQARQLVVHRHFTVNGRRVDRPSYRMRPGDVIEVHERSRAKYPFRVAAEGGWAPERIPGYLDVQLDRLTARLLRLPVRAEIPVACEEQLVVEHYSR